MLELGAKALAQRDASYLLARDGIEHDQVLGEHRKRLDGIGQAQDVEHPEHIGAELDAGADFLELLGLLEELHCKPLARKRQRRRQAANPSSHHENRGLSCPVEHMSALIRAPAAGGRPTTSHTIKS